MEKDPFTNLLTPESRFMSRNVVGKSQKKLLLRQD